MNIIRHKYNCHKSKAKYRGIEFKLTFEEWWGVWEASGKWEQRGKTIGKYCMSRYSDQGPYEIGNVYIQLWTENTSQAHKGSKKPRPEGFKPYNYGVWDDLKPETKRRLYKNGDHRVPKNYKPEDPRKMPVKINDAVYESIAHAARQLNLSERQIQYRLKIGHPGYIKL